MANVPFLQIKTAPVDKAKKTQCMCRGVLWAR